jgi:tetratricopeptide (TPR) repeat protein
MSQSRNGLPMLLAALALSFLFLATCVRADTDDADLRKQALALNDVTGDQPMRGKVLALVEDAANTKKLLAVAAKIAKEAKEKDQPFNFNGAYILARTAQALKDVEGSERFYRICVDQGMSLKSSHKLGLAFGGLIDMYYENKKYNESEKVCQEFLELNGDDTIKRLKPLVLRRQIQAMARQDKVDEATKLVDNLIKANPGNWLTLELRGWVQREAGDYAAAAKTYEEVLEAVEKDKELKTDEKSDVLTEYRYVLSGIYVDANEIDKAADKLKALLKEDESNPTFNNDLGYIWADHDKNLEEAEKLIRKALEEERKLRKKLQPDLKPEELKDNASFVDSLGWVLFKQKKYKEAKEYLLQATKDPDDGQHLEIYDHLGDVCQALGEKDEAVAAWKKAVELAGQTKREQLRKTEVEKKLKENQ